MRGMMGNRTKGIDTDGIKEQGRGDRMSLIREAE